MQPRTTTRVRGLGVIAAGALAASTLAAAPAVQAQDIEPAPHHTISGAGTELHFPNGVARKNDTLYVANSNDNSITEYDISHSGDAAPTKRIFSFSSSSLYLPTGVAVDKEGFVYVAAASGHAIEVYAPDANGEVYPVRRIAGAATGLVGAEPASIGVDAQGRIYVTVPIADKLLQFAPSAQGNVAPERVLTGPATNLDYPEGLFVTPSGTIHVGTSNAVLTFNWMKNGNVAPDRIIGGPNSQISSATGLGLDSAGRLYVANHDDDSIVVFAKDANGNVAPARRLIGATTGLNDPSGLVVDGDGTIYSAQYASNAINVYGPLFPTEAKPAPPKAKPASPKVTKPSKPRNLKVRGAKKRTLTWSAPARTGHAKVTRYKIVVKKGSRTLASRTVPGSKHKITIKRSHLRRGRNKVFVKAKNSKGYGNNATKVFRVRKKK